MSSSGTASTPLKIAMGGRSLLTPLTGIGQYVQHLMRGMVAQGHELRLFYGTHWSQVQALDTAATRDGEPAPRASHPRLLALARGFVRKHAPGLARLAPLLEQGRFLAGIRGHGEPDIYHEPNFVAFRCHRPTVITVHDVSWVRHPEYHPAARLALLRAHFPAALARASQVIVVSDFVRRELLECFPVDANKVRVVYNGVSPRFAPLEAAQIRPMLDKHGLNLGRYLVAVGTLEPRKNLITALEAHARLPLAMQRAFPLVLVGTEGWLTDSLHARLREPVQRGTTRLLGYVHDAELPALICGARALVYPSVYEGFGLPPLEAMACGVPVVGSRAGAVREIVGDAGLLNEAFDVEAFTHSMQAVMEDAGLHTRLAKSGRERARHFSWHKAVDETLAVYRSALA